jgi:hypothetical protein
MRLRVDCNREVVQIDFWTVADLISVPAITTWETKKRAASGSVIGEI